MYHVNDLKIKEHLVMYRFLGRVQKGRVGYFRPERKKNEYRIQCFEFHVVCVDKKTLLL